MMFKQAWRSLSTTAAKNRIYGGRATAALIPGDGIGPEMADHLIRTFQAIKAPVDFELVNLNAKNWSEDNYQNAIKAIKRSGCAIKGNITTPMTEDVTIKPRNQKLRADLNIFANVVHAKSLNGIDNNRFKDIDIYIVRENTEGEYSGKEHESVPGVVESLKIMTRPSIERIARFAFEFAKSHDRKKVTCVHKANIMKQGDGLFLKVCGEIAKEYPEIAFEGMIVDNTCMQLVSNPWQFDVMLLPNLYGNIVSNVCCGLTGGAGLTAGSNYSGSINEAPNQVGLFEMATRNTGDSIVGQNVANPTGFLMAGAKLLEYNRMYEHANMIRPALAKTINEDKVHTADIGGSATTAEFMMAFNDNLMAQVDIFRYAEQD